LRMGNYSSALVSDIKRSIPIRARVIY